MTAYLTPAHSAQHKTRLPTIVGTTVMNVWHSWALRNPFMTSDWQRSSSHTHHRLHMTCSTRSETKNLTLKPPFALLPPHNPKHNNQHSGPALQTPTMQCDASLPLGYLPPPTKLTPETLQLILSHQPPSLPETYSKSKRSHHPPYTYHSRPINLLV